MMLIKNGRVIDPITDVDDIMDVLIDGDKISEVAKDISCPDAQVIDATGLIVGPGLCDTHVHFRDPGFTYKEDIETGLKAAAKGGFTTVICMANTKPVVDSVETLNYIYDKADKVNLTRLYQTATVTKGMQGKELVDMKTLKANGAVGFTDDGVPVLDKELLLQAMKEAKALDVPIALHEEDPLFIKGAGVNMGRVSEELNYGGASHIAEDIMVARDLVLAMETGCDTCIQHISSGVSVELVRAMKKLCSSVYAEATPHHFTLTEEEVLKSGTNARMNPPLRTEADRQAIIDGIKDGTIDMIVTDHAPHSTEEKARSMATAPSGITGLETSLGLAVKVLVHENGLSLKRLFELMSVNPMRLYRLTPPSIRKGSVADIVILSEDEKWVVKAEEFASKASNSPFVGWELPGRVHMTIRDGRIIYSI
ncbi:MAG: dihydroorotase [Lachnospiraceae bacterium]|nr:dihydroorotase [Lachnospiraceae bacterium]